MGIVKASIKLIKGQARLAVGVAAGVLVGSGAAVVFAAIPDSTGVIHACYTTSGLVNLGLIRIIDNSSQSCLGTETAISWNSTTTGQFVTNLVGADFSNTSLAYRNFAGVDMHGATFSNTPAQGANFAGANLSGSTFSNSVTLRNANLTGTNFSSSDFSGSLDFTGTTHTSINLSSSAWHDADVTGDLSGADFSVTHPSSVMFDGTNLSNAKFTGFSSFTLGVNFYQANLTNVDFRGSTLNGAKFQSATVTGANFTNDAILYADMTGTDFSGATLTGVTWTSTTCPDGTNSDDHGNTCTGHLVP